MIIGISFHITDVLTMITARSFLTNESMRPRKVRALIAQLEGKERLPSLSECSLFFMKHFTQFDTIEFKNEYEELKTLLKYTADETVMSAIVSNWLLYQKKKMGGIFLNIDTHHFKYKHPSLKRGVSYKNTKNITFYFLPLPFVFLSSHTAHLPFAPPLDEVFLPNLRHHFLPFLHFYLTPNLFFLNG